MNSKGIKVFSPATVANVGCGFDVMGFALDTPGDVIEVKERAEPGIIITNLVKGVNLPLEPEKNTTGIALIKYLEHIESNLGFEVIFHEKINPGSGIGSSSASAVAGIFAVNELLERPLTKKELVPFAMEGERVACGVAHADNVAPALLGGFVLIRSYVPLDIVSIPFPDALHCTVVHPQLEVKTEDARKVLKKTISLKDAITQWGNVGGLVAGLATGDIPLIGRSLEDVVIEPIRSLLIPGYHQVKEAALDTGAMGCSISGSGPTLFALSDSEGMAQQVGYAMQASFKSLGVDSTVYVSKINKQGPRVI